MLNQIALIGRLTKDPEIKLVGKDQNSVVRFILAVNRPKYGDSKPQADFIPVVACHKVCRMYSQMMISTMPEDLMITLVVLVMTKNGRFK